MRALILAVLSAFATAAVAGDAPPPATPPNRTGPTLVIRVTEDGFQPRELKLKKGELAALAEREAAGGGWLPEILRPAA